MTDLGYGAASPQTDLGGLNHAAIATLESAIGNLRSCPEPQIRAWAIPPEALTLDGANDFIGSDLADLSANKPTLYRISVSGDQDLEAVLAAFDIGKGAVPERSYARRHGTLSKFLYVGRSSSIKKRIKEHLGFGARQTYALNLAAWASSLNVAFLLECATYDPSVQASTLSNLEDTLWSRSSPMFGRQGSL